MSENLIEPKNFDLIEESIYPLTIVSDRYNGTYSGGKFTAWNREPDDVPEGITGDDCSCHFFWLHNHIVCGVGDTIQEAIGNLYINLNREVDDDE